MSADHVQVYQQKLLARKQATRRVEELVRQVDQIAESLRHWPRVIIGNSAGGYPQHVMNNPKAVSIDANSWPDIHALNAALAAYHEAVFQVTAAWNLVPGERRVGLAPPT